jgi:putative ABC transport system permease protein
MLPDRLRRISRRLWRAPLFTFIAVLTLGVGIGANGAIFSVVNGVLLKPLPFDEPDRLVGVWLTAPGAGFPIIELSPGTYLTFRESGRTLDDLGLWDTYSVTVTGSGEPERVDALMVTDGTFGVMRIEPQLGRRFSAEDDSPRTPERVMLSDAYWRRTFGGDPSIIGRPIVVDGKPREIIGVLPAGFRFLDRQFQIVLPFRLNRAEVHVANFSYPGVGRLKPGVTLEQANADIARMIPLAMDRFPMPPGMTRKMLEDAKLGPKVRPLSADVIGDVGRVLWVLFGTVGLVLLIACANVANLFLVRAEGRQQELAIHAALGAGRGRLAWELLSESLMLGFIGGIVGLALAYVGVRALVAAAPRGLPRVSDIGIDPAVILFTVAVSLLAGVLFGLLPIVRFARPQLTSALKEGGRLSSAGRERHRIRNTLVVVEIAMAVVLLVASGLMIRTFQAMRRVDPGFTDPEEVLTLRVAIPETLVPQGEQMVRMYEAILRNIERIPGVTSVGMASTITMDGGGSNDPIFVEDFPIAAGGLPPIRRFKWISENYFQTMGTRLLAGRHVTWLDIYNTNEVVVVSENFAREYWKEPAAALGRRIRQSPQNPWRTIVGVVADTRDNGVARPAPAIMHWPMMMKEFWDNKVFVPGGMTYAIRTQRAGSPTLVKEIQQAVWSVNGNLPVANVRTLDDIRSRSMAQTSFALVILAIAGAVALLLGIVGIYGVISYVASQRTREVGIRMALGAAKRDVSRLFIRHGLLLTAAGVVLGTIAAAALTRAMATLLFGVSALDPLTYVAVALALGATALVATYLPARRAARIDPAAALRWEA